jgi:hypothetical protein
LPNLVREVIKRSKPTNLEETPKRRKRSDPEKESENKMEVTNKRNRNSSLRRKNISLLPSIANPSRIRNLYTKCTFHTTLIILSKL